MTEQLAMLMEYQGLDDKVRAIEDGLRASAVRKKLLHARNYLVNSQNNLQKMEAEAEELRSLLETVQTKYAASLKELDEMGVHFEAADEESDGDDVAEMRRLANNLLNDLTRQEKELTGLMKRLANMDQEVKKMATNIPKAKADYASLKVTYDEELAKVQARTAPIKEEMEALGQKIGDALMARYRSARQSNATNPIVPLSGSRCTGCHMDLPSAAAKKIREEQCIGECENCGRILYAE